MAVTVIFLAIEYALFELQRMPYRPPMDNSTFLTTGEISAVRVFMALVAAIWLLFVTLIAADWAKSRSASGPSPTDR